MLPNSKKRIAEIFSIARDVIRLFADLCRNFREMLEILYRV